MAFEETLDDASPRSYWTEEEISCGLHCDGVEFFSILLVFECDCDVVGV